MLTDILNKLNQTSEEYELSSSFCDVISVSGKRVTVALNDRPGIYEDCIVMGDYIPVVKEKGILYFAGDNFSRIFIPIYNKRFKTTITGGDRYGEYSLDPDKWYGNGTNNGKVSGTPTCLADYIKVGDRGKYIDIRVSAFRTWGDLVTCERIVKFSQLIYNNFGKTTRINDMCCWNGKYYYSPLMSNGTYHETHDDGSSCDIGIDTLTNSTAKDYSRVNTIKALSILVNEVGTRNKRPSIYFDDNSYTKDGQFWPDKSLNGYVKNIGGHTNHYHVFFVDRILR